MCFDRLATLGVLHMEQRVPGFQFAGANQLRLILGR